MKAIKRNSENLKKVCNSILEVPFSCGNFIVEFSTKDSVCLFSCDRHGIGTSILSLIPTNYEFRIVFDETGLRLYIWFD